MSTIEQRLEQLWGEPVLAYCTSCGAPVRGLPFACGHMQSAAWADLTARQKTLVRRLAITTFAQTKRSATSTATVAS